MKTPTFRFTFYLESLHEDQLDPLFEAGCGDGTFGWIDGKADVIFAREAPSFPEAVTSAIRDVEAVPGMRVSRIDLEELLTASEIAERLGRSRESIRLLAAGRRGDGTFPAPTYRTGSRSSLWLWSEVAEWAGSASPEYREQISFVKMMNAALAFRERDRLDAGTRRMVEQVARIA